MHLLVCGRARLPFLLSVLHMACSCNIYNQPRGWVASGFGWLGWCQEGQLIT